MSTTQQIINELNSTINGFTGKINVQVNQINQTTQKVKATADNTLREISNFKTEMIENEQMKSAQENILRINQIIREVFYDYDTIRKTVLGVVKDFDLSLVRNKTITELSEELWITSSRYWLAYTLIALSAWINDNKALTDNAVSESMRTDEAKTTLFFCLVNLRFGRIDPARNWLTAYFKSVVPEDLREETSVLIQSYINGVFGCDAELAYEVQGIIDDWVKQVQNNDETVSFLKGTYTKYIGNLAPRVGYRNEYISQYCAQAKEMIEPYREAAKYDILISKVKEVDVENITNNPTNFKKRIDNILKDLITNYDAEEQELKDQQAYFNLVIENNGKEEVAEVQYNALMEAKNRKSNFGEKCVEWALYSNNADINVHVRKFGFQHTKPWLLDALTTWSTNFEAKFPESYDIKIDDWTCTSTGEDQDEQVASLRSHIEGMKKKIIWDKKVVKRLIFGSVFLVLGLVLVLLKAASAIKFMGFAALGAAAIFLLLFGIRLGKGQSRFNELMRSSLDKLNGTMSEITQYRKVYLENVNKKGTLFSMIDHL